MATAVFIRFTQCPDWIRYRPPAGTENQNHQGNKHVGMESEHGDYGTLQQGNYLPMDL